MIPKVVQRKVTLPDGSSRWENGRSAPGLVRYLMGPGNANEHTNQHVLASSGTLAVEFAGTTVDEWRQGAAGQLGRLVEGAWRERRAAGEAGSVADDRGHVFHVSLSLRADEGQLDDAVWGRIAVDYVTAMGFTGAPGRAECQWIAVRHGLSTNGNDHIHLAICLVRDDGRWASDHQSMLRSQRIARDLEQRYGLRRLHDDEGRGMPGVHAAELRRAKDAGRPEPERVTLERLVRSAGVLSSNEPSFLAALLARGVRVRPLFAAGGRDKVVGYSVALRPTTEPAENTTPTTTEQRGTQPLWFSGSRLARDLTLPALRERWGSDPADEAAALPTWRGEAVPSQNPTQAREASMPVRHLEELARQLANVDPADRDAWRRIAGTLAGTLGEWSALSEPGRPGRAALAARALARSTQTRTPVTSRRHVRQPRSQPVDEIDKILSDLARAVRPKQRNTWLPLLLAADRTAQAIHRAHLARHEAAAAQLVAEAVGRDLQRLRAELAAGSSGARSSADLHPANRSVQRRRADSAIQATNSGR